MFQSCYAFLPLLLSRQVFTLSTAVTYPEREGSDKLSSAVIGRLRDDTAERRRGDGQEEKLLHIKQKVHPHVAALAPCRTSSSARFKGQRWHQLDSSDSTMDRFHYDVEGGFDETDKGKPWHSSTLTSHIQLQRRNFSLTWTRSNFVPVLQKSIFVCALSVSLLRGFRVVVVPRCQVL